MNFDVMNNDINKEFSHIEGTEEGIFEIMAPVGSRESLAAAIQADDRKAAFEAAHAIKGVMGNTDRLLFG